MSETTNSPDLNEISEFLEEPNDAHNNNELLPNHTRINKFLSIQKITNTDNAIVLNRKMQNMLKELQKVVQEMLNKCQEKYKKNEELLKKSMKTNQPKQMEKRFKTYALCGTPFFKIGLNSAPPNSDYLYRRDVEKELFPADIILTRNIFWTLNDKINVIKGVKEQVISHLKDDNNAAALSGINTRNLKGRVLEKNEQFHSLLLVDLLKMTNKSFVINWYRISTENLKHRHNEMSCDAMWNMYLRPELNRSNWSIDETNKLEQLVQQYSLVNWSNIANEMGNRSEYQCYIHYITVIFEKTRVQNRNWTEEESNLLIEAVEKSRVGNVIRWSIVQQYFPHRNKKQLNTRYNYSLDPKIMKRGNFTKEEDCVILAAIQEYGENFSTMPNELFPGRCIIQVRNRYKNTLKSISKHKVWTPEDDQKLLNFVDENGFNYRKLSDEFDNRHTRTSCRQRYATIMKFFNKNPNATVNDIPRKSKNVQTDITTDNWKTKFREIQNGNLEINIKEKIQKNYITKLRTRELKYYNFFKHSYDYKFAKEPFILYNPLMNINFLTNLFELNIDENLLNEIEKLFSSNDIKLLKMLLKIREHNMNNIKKIKFNIELPPNWSTLLGFRGFCIQCASETEKVLPLNHKSNENGKFKRAKEKFRERFYSIFKKTMLLTRLNPNNLNIQERFSENMDLGLKEMQEIYAESVNDNNDEFFEMLKDNLNKRKCEENKNERTVKRIKSENK